MNSVSCSTTLFSEISEDAEPLPVLVNSSHVTTAGALSTLSNYLLARAEKAEDAEKRLLLERVAHRMHQRAMAQNP